MATRRRRAYRLSKSRSRREAAETIEVRSLEDWRNHPDPKLLRTTYGMWLAVSRDGDPLRIGVIGMTADSARDKYANAAIQWFDTLTRPWTPPPAEPGLIRLNSVRDDTMATLTFERLRTMGAYKWLPTVEWIEGIRVTGWEAEYYEGSIPKCDACEDYGTWVGEDGDVEPCPKCKGTSAPV